MIWKAVIILIVTHMGCFKNKFWALWNMERQTSSSSAGTYIILTKCEALWSALCMYSNTLTAPIWHWYFSFSVLCVGHWDLLKVMWMVSEKLMYQNCKSGCRTTSHGGWLGSSGLEITLQGSSLLGPGDSRLGRGRGLSRAITEVSRRGHCLVNMGEKEWKNGLHSSPH